MGNILFYLKSIAFYCAAVTPLIVLMRLMATPVMAMKNQKTTFFHEMGVVAFLFSVTAILSQTVNFSLLFSNSAKIASGGINFSPFYGIYDIIQNGSTLYIAINIMGNILMFAPIGFLIPLVWRKGRSAKVVFASGLLFSLSIEFMQLFVYRGTDIDDVILNVSGAMLGYGAYRLFQNLFPAFAQKFTVAARVPKPQRAYPAKLPQITIARADPRPAQKSAANI